MKLIPDSLIFFHNYLKYTIVHFLIADFQLFKQLKPYLKSGMNDNA